MGAESLIAELRDLVTCRCSADYTKRGLRDPACNCDTAPALDALAARLAECEANLAQAIADLLAERAAKTIIGQSYESERTAREAAEADARRLAFALVEYRQAMARLAADDFDCDDYMREIFELADVGAHAALNHDGGANGRIR